MVSGSNGAGNCAANAEISARRRGAAEYNQSPGARCLRTEILFFDTRRAYVMVTGHVDPAREDRARVGLEIAMGLAQLRALSCHERHVHLARSCCKICERPSVWLCRDGEIWPGVGAGWQPVSNRQSYLVAADTDARQVDPKFCTPRSAGR